MSDNLLVQVFNTIMRESGFVQDTTNLSYIVHTDKTTNENIPTHHDNIYLRYRHNKYGMIRIIIWITDKHVNVIPVGYIETADNRLKYDLHNNFVDDLKSYIKSYIDNVSKTYKIIKHYMHKLTYDNLMYANVSHDVPIHACDRNSRYVYENLENKDELIDDELAHTVEILNYNDSYIYTCRSDVKHWVNNWFGYTNEHFIWFRYHTVIMNEYAVTMRMFFDKYKLTNGHFDKFKKHYAALVDDLRAIDSSAW